MAIELYGIRHQQTHGIEHSTKKQKRVKKWEAHTAEKKHGRGNINDCPWKRWEWKDIEREWASELTNAGDTQQYDRAI